VTGYNSRSRHSPNSQAHSMSLTSWILAAVARKGQRDAWARRSLERALRPGTAMLRRGWRVSCQEGMLVCRVPCQDVKHGTERAEEVVCLRRGTNRVANQVLWYRIRLPGAHDLFSGYPVVLDGIVHRLNRPACRSVGIRHRRLDSRHGDIGGRIGVLLRHDVLCWQRVAPGRRCCRVFPCWAGLSLGPIRMRSFSVSEGALWEMTRQRRLEDGESPEQADRPVDVKSDGSGDIPAAQGGNVMKPSFRE
jgi:hypothetical protein